MLAETSNRLQNNPQRECYDILSNLNKSVNSDLEIISWAKDSHGLYDYENEEGITNNLHGIKPGF